MNSYDNSWSDFEIQSLAFSILRKNLYPHYLVRGNYKFPTNRVDIAIFKSKRDKTTPELRLVLEISTNPKIEHRDKDKHKETLKVPTVFITHGKDAYNALRLVQDYL